MPHLTFVSTDPDRLGAGSMHQKYKKSSKRGKGLDRHSSSQDNIKYQIKNGVLRQSAESSELGRSNLPAIRVSRLQAGPGGNDYARGDFG